MRTILHAPHHRPAFTLIELLVVISIISLLLPALKAARDQARQTLCMSNMRQYGLSAALYDQVYKELPRQRGNSNEHNEFEPTVINTLVNDFGMSKKFKICPSAPTWAPASNLTRSMFAILGGRGRYTGGPTINDSGWRPLRWNLHYTGWYPQISTVKPDNRSVMPFFWSDYTHTLLNANASMPPVANHNYGPGTAKGGNVLYLDGHVKWQALEAGKSWRVGSSAYGYVHWFNDSAYQPPTPLAPAHLAYYTP